MTHKTRTVYLTRGYTTIVSDVDYDRVMAKGPWSINGKNSLYAKTDCKRGGRRIKVYMHRFIRNTPKGLVTNHRDGDTLNNTRPNLHDITNRANVSTYRVKKGVVGYNGVNYKDGKLGETTERRNMRARIQIGSKRLSIGVFYTAKEAAIAYDYAAVDAFGTQADTNFPLSNYICEIELPNTLPEAYYAGIPF